MDDKFKIFVESESAATEEVLFHELSHICLNASGWVKYRTYSQNEMDQKLDTVLNWILSLIQHPPIWNEMNTAGYDVQRAEITWKENICNALQRSQFCHEFFPNERLHVRWG